MQCLWVLPTSLDDMLFCTLQDGHAGKHRTYDELEYGRWFFYNGGSGAAFQQHPEAR